MANLAWKIQDWLAEHVKGIQYPDHQSADKPLVEFKNKMSWQLRLALLLFGGGMITVGAVILAVMGIAIFGALFA